MNVAALPYLLGDAQVTGPLAVFPVFGPESRLRYRAFADATLNGVRVRELEGGAAVEMLVVENPTDTAVLIYEGEEVLGAQQNRTFDTSVLLAPGQRAEVPVSCVERGRWDGSRHIESFASSPQAADPALRRVKRSAANRRAAAGGLAGADQAEVWDQVQARLVEHGVESATDSMHDLYEARRGELADLTEVVSICDGQIGAVAAVSGKPVAVDVVSNAQAFTALLPRLAQGYALDALGGQPMDPDPDAAEELLFAGLRASRRAVKTPGVGQGFVVEERTVVGAGLDCHGELIQLCAFPVERRNSLALGPIARPSRGRPHAA